ncbi:MAG: NAD(P)/FAD-dependent oxidoreductase [Bacteroides sp.]|nr:NAD(P)/FAD-dependent oxidoreductase [Bacteroides sp.]
MDQRKTIVVIGGGFAGLTLVKQLDKQLYKVILIDRNNYHSFPPLFYQVASSGLEPDSICFPFRRELHKGKGVGAEFHLGTVERIELDAHRVVTEYETVAYDILVIAAGTTNNFFGNDKLVESVFTIKSTAQAMRARDEILSRLERASLCRDAAQGRKLLSFTVVGGGASGVEIAGALGEMKRYILKRNYPTIDPEDVRITLLEGGDTVLASMDEHCREHATQYLKDFCVDLRLGCIMKEYTDGVAILSNGEKVDSAMLIWTAGVTGVKIPMSSAGKDVDLAAGGNRIPVDAFNRVVGHESDMYALGDIALMASDALPRGHAQVAQVAIQQARNLAHNLNKGRMETPFVYHDKGTMATIGRNRAVADIGGKHLWGFPAWLTWMFVHLISIVGMRNKINILIDWTWGYFNYGTSLRILLSPSRYPLRWRWGEK